VRSSPSVVVIVNAVTSPSVRNSTISSGSGQIDAVISQTFLVLSRILRIYTNIISIKNNNQNELDIFKCSVKILKLT
jgi:hypothetical protein